VGVYTGILPITKDENGLATVIGHEVAHAYARHGGERVSQAMVSQGPRPGRGNRHRRQQVSVRHHDAYGVGSKVGFRTSLQPEA